MIQHQIHFFTSKKSLNKINNKKIINRYINKIIYYLRDGTIVSKHATNSIFMVDAKITNYFTLFL